MWVISFDFCIGRAPHSSHADSCVLRGLVVCVIWSVMLVRYGCFGGGIWSFVAYGGGVCPSLRGDSSANWVGVRAWWACGWVL